MRRTRITRIAGAGLALTLAVGMLAGCGAPAKQATAPAAPAKTQKYPVTLKDDAGREVTIASAPARIVSLAPANTEIVYSLGALDRLVGVTTYDDYPAAVSGIAKVGDFTTPNLEAIAAAKPKLILVTGGVQADVVSKLEALGAQVLVVDPKDLAGVYRAIGMVAQALGVPAKGDSVVAGMKSQLAAIEKKIAGDPPVSCFVEIGWNPLYTAGKGTLIDDLVTKAGGANVVTQEGYVGYSVEQLVKDQPRVYFGTKSSFGDSTDISQRPGYHRIAAIISGRVYVLDDNTVSRPGPRVVEAVAAMAQALHPERF